MKLHSILKLKAPKAGLLGVEIECESNSTHFPSPDKYWKQTSDGSLRKTFNTEYVLRKPYSLAGTTLALKELTECWEKHRTCNEPSVRTGVHIHVNCTDMSSTQILNFILTYLSMERVLSKYCGETREGNLFCLRAADCPSIVGTIGHAFTLGAWNLLSDVHGLKYSGLNVTTLRKHGSLEFRSLQTPVNPMDIREWIDILMAVREYSLSLEAGVQIPYDMSYYSHDLWVRKVLGDKLYDRVHYPGLGADVKKDMRNIQSLYHVKPVPFEEEKYDGDVAKAIFLDENGLPVEPEDLF